MENEIYIVSFAYGFSQCVDHSSIHHPIGTLISGSIAGFIYGTVISLVSSFLPRQIQPVIPAILVIAGTLQLGIRLIDGSV